jgi:membrane protein
MSKPISKFLKKNKAVQLLVRVAEKITLPGFDGLSLYEVMGFFFIGLNRGGMKMRASSMAYSFFLAIFPAIICLFTLLPYIPVKNFQVELLETIQSIMPSNAFSAIEETITEILSSHNSKLLSIGFLSAIFFATNGFTSMMGAFNKSIHVKEVRAAWKQRLIAIALVFFLFIVLAVAITLILGSEFLLARMMKTDSVERAFIYIGRWLIIGGLFTFIIGVFYRVGPSQRMSRSLISPGVLLATLLTMLSSIGFAWYANNFGSYNKLYGSIGSIIVMLVWIYYNSMMLLIGFELDASIHGAREKRQTLLEHEEEEMEREEAEV